MVVLAVTGRDASGTGSRPAGCWQSLGQQPGSHPVWVFGPSHVAAAVVPESCSYIPRLDQ
jgi:hypothetical protein